MLSMIDKAKLRHYSSALKITKSFKTRVKGKKLLIMPQATFVLKEPNNTQETLVYLLLTIVKFNVDNGLKLCRCPGLDSNQSWGSIIYRQGVSELCRSWKITLKTTYFVCFLSLSTCLNKYNYMIRKF